MNTPTFLILGAPKAGTTTLYRVLEAHPDITFSRPKEPPFFEAEYELGLDYYWQTYFGHWNGEQAIGDARSVNLFLPYVAERIKASLPGVKLIAILRNPVDRVYSHWWMRKCSGTEELDFEAAIQRNLRAIEQGSTLDGESGKKIWLDYQSRKHGIFPCYLQVGYYAQHLRAYLDLFPSSRIKVLFFEDLIYEPEQLYTDVLDFLGVSSDVPLPVNYKFNAAPNRIALVLHRFDRFLNVPKQIPESMRHKISSAVRLLGKPPKIDPAFQRWLSDYYAPHNRQLEAITGRDLAHWG